MIRESRYRFSFNELLNSYGVYDLFHKYLKEFPLNPRHMGEDYFLYFNPRDWLCNSFSWGATSNESVWMDLHTRWDRIVESLVPEGEMDRDYEDEDYEDENF